MAKNIHKIARLLGANVVARTPNAGGGAFGAARLAALLSARLSPSAGRRPGRPTDATWVCHPKVPMSEQTLEGLSHLAEKLSTDQRKVSPMQVAAQLLEESLERYLANLPG